MEAKRLCTLKDLKVGQVLTEITNDSFRCWEVLARDPRLDPNKELFDKYIYVVDSFGRKEVERWYESSLQVREIYLGYDKELVLDMRIERLKSQLLHLLDLKEKSRKEVIPS